MSRALLVVALGSFVMDPGEVAAERDGQPINAIQWETLPPLPDSEGFAGLFAGVVNGALLVGGGANIAGDKWREPFAKKWYDAVYVLDREGRAWKQTQSLPRPLGYGVSISTTEGVICLGGSDASRHYADVFRVGMRDGKLHSSPLPPLPRPCANACGALLNRTIYIAGGIDRPDAPAALKTFWALDLDVAPLQWRELEPWPGAARMLAVAGVQQGSFYLMSGAALHGAADRRPTREYLRDAYRFTPGDGWKRIADLPRAAVAAPSPAIPCNENELMIVSGDDGTHVTFSPVRDHPGFPKTLLIYDATIDRWRVGPITPLSRVTTPVVQWQNRFVIPNGEVRPRVRTAEVWGMRCGTERPCMRGRSPARRGWWSRFFGRSRYSTISIGKCSPR